MQRIRSDGTSKNLFNYGNIVYYYNGVKERSLSGEYLHPISYGGNAVPVGDKYRWMQDIVTPGFQKILGSGKVLPVNPMLSHQVSYEGTPLNVGGSVRFGSGGWKTYSYYGNRSLVQFTNNSTWLGANIPYLDSAEMLQASLAKIKTRGWDVGTSAAELHKTVRMFLGLKAKMIRLVEALLQRVTTRNVFNLFDELSNAWLELRYGWRILLYEMEDFQNHVETIQSATSGLVRYTTFGTDTRSTTQDLVVTNVYGEHGVTGIDPWPIALKVKRSITIKRDMRAMVGVNGRLVQTAFLDPVVTAWELVPFSFIIDWFMNIDEMLKAWSPFLEAQIACTSLTDRTHVIVHDVYTAENRSGQNGWTVSGYYCEPGVGVHTYVKTERTSPQATIDLSSKVDLNMPKVVDLVSIIYGMFRRNLRFRA